MPSLTEPPFFKNIPSKLWYDNMSDKSLSNNDSSTSWRQIRSALYPEHKIETNLRFLIEFSMFIIGLCMTHMITNFNNCNMHTISNY